MPEDDPQPEWIPDITWKALSRDDNARNLRQFVKTSAAQGAPMDIGGYYQPDDALAEKAMRPSATFNAVIDAL